MDEKAPTTNPLEEARKLIEQNKAERTRACGQIITEALKQHGCVLDVVLEKHGESFIPKINIVAQ